MLRTSVTFFSRIVRNTMETRVKRKRKTVLKLFIQKACEETFAQRIWRLSTVFSRNCRIDFDRNHQLYLEMMRTPTAYNYSSFVDVHIFQLKKSVSLKFFFQNHLQGSLRVCQPIEKVKNFGSSVNLDLNWIWIFRGFKSVDSYGGSKQKMSILWQG